MAGERYILVVTCDSCPILSCRVVYSMNVDVIMVPPGEPRLSPTRPPT